MSSPSLLSEFSPRIRNRQSSASLLALNQQSRNVLSRMLKRRTLKDEILSFYARQSEGIPEVPSYLSNTMYAHLVEQQEILFKKRLSNIDQFRKTLAEPTEAMMKRVQQILIQQMEDDRMELTFNDHHHALSSTDKKLPSTQEYAILETLLTRDHFNLALAIQDLRLPTAWDVKARGEHVDISPDHLQLTYTGTGKEDTDVSSVRANHAMRRQCGIYYFEVQIVSKGIDGHIGIGFCRRINSLDRFPGWEEHSWGYHGENGNIASGPGTAKTYGPKYGTGDIIGCGIDFRDMSAFYTKNGIYLGTAFKKIKETDIYPFVGFKTPGEKIEANFGSRPFKFDILQYRSNEKRELLNKITIKSIESTTSRSAIINKSVASDIADEVVVEFLRHNGYNKSATALEKAMKFKSNTPVEDSPAYQLDPEALQRQDIRHDILGGDIDRAIDLCNTYYPSVLKNNPFIEFKLQCRKFMEMVKRSQRHNQAMTNNDEYEARSLAVSKNHHHKAIKRTTSNADLDLHNIKKKKQKMNEQEQDLESLQAVMAFGNLLQQRYGPESETNEAMKSELMLTFSTLAYSDLSNKAVAYLFETPYIETVASELNSAILVSLGKYPDSSLERIYRQTSAAIEELVLNGNAKAALLQPERDCLKQLDL